MDFHAQECSFILVPTILLCFCHKIVVDLATSILKQCALFLLRLPH